MPPPPRDEQHFPWVDYDTVFLGFFEKWKSLAIEVVDIHLAGHRALIEPIRSVHVFRIVRRNEAPSSGLEVSVTRTVKCT